MYTSTQFTTYSTVSNLKYGKIFQARDSIYLFKSRYESALIDFLIA